LYAILYTNKGAAVFYVNHKNSLQFLKYNLLYLCGCFTIRTIDVKNIKKKLKIPPNSLLLTTYLKEKKIKKSFIPTVNILIHLRKLLVKYLKS